MTILHFEMPCRSLPFSQPHRNAMFTILATMGLTAHQCQLHPTPIVGGFVPYTFSKLQGAGMTSALLCMDTHHVTHCPISGWDVRSPTETRLYMGVDVHNSGERIRYSLCPGNAQTSIYRTGWQIMSRANTDSRLSMCAPVR